MRLHFVEQTFADVVVHLGEHVRPDDPGERLHQPLALVARGKLDQVGDVGWMEGLNQPARGLVVTGVDGIEHLVDERRAEPVFLVHRRRGVDGRRGGDVLALAQFLTPLLNRWRPPMGAAALAQPPRGP